MKSQHSSSSSGAKRVTCPTCGQFVDPALTSVMPFCSPRCQQIDLGHWFNEEIGLPIDPEDEFDEQPTSDN
jgi:endogenous inhibitor of DNA gyrase (YacG/DUF329 family)